MERPRSIANKTTMKLLVALSLLNIYLPCSLAYPMMVTLPPGRKERCFSFDIPEGDNARMVIMPIANTDSDAVVEYYSNALRNQMWENAVPPPSVDIIRQLQYQDLRTGVFARLKRVPRPILRHIPLKYHSGVVFLNIANMGVSRYTDSEISTYELCFNPSSTKEKVKLMFDFELKSDFDDKQDELDKKKDTRELSDKKVIKKTQFEPLEKNLQQSVSKGNRIVSQLKYMERREARMRETTESTNIRVRYFSYLSIFMMVATTFLQAYYLKRYFKKKKAL